MNNNDDSTNNDNNMLMVMVVMMMIQCIITFSILRTITLTSDQIFRVYLNKAVQYGLCWNVEYVQTL